MAFYIDIGYSTDPPEKVNRAYTIIKENVPIAPTSIIDQLHPVFIIDMDNTLLNANYVVANFLGRKYFGLISVNTAHRIVITCSVDYLAFDVSECDITVTRNGGIGKPTYIPDNKLPILPNRETITSTTASNPYFSVGLLENHCYLVTVINGGALT